MPCFYVCELCAIGCIGARVFCVCFKLKRSIWDFECAIGVMGLGFCVI